MKNAVALPYVEPVVSNRAIDAASVTRICLLPVVNVPPGIAIVNVTNPFESVTNFVESITALDPIGVAA